MKLLVTGGAGFIGSNLVHYLMREAASELELDIEKVVTLDKLTYAGNVANLEPVEADQRHLLIQPYGNGSRRDWMRKAIWSITRPPGQ